MKKESDEQKEKLTGMLMRVNKKTEEIKKSSTAYPESIEVSVDKLMSRNLTSKDNCWSTTNF